MAKHAATDRTSALSKPTAWAGPTTALASLLGETLMLAASAALPHRPVALRLPACLGASRSLAIRVGSERHPLDAALSSAELLASFCWNALASAVPARGRPLSRPVPAPPE